MRGQLAPEWGVRFHRNIHPKLIFPEIAMESRFAYDKKGFLLNKTCFFIDSDDLLLLSLLNSKLVWFFLKSICSVLGDANSRGRLMLQKIYVEQVPIPELTSEIKETLKAISSQIINAKEVNSNADTTTLEREIDMQVYRLYGLTEDEIEVVENSKII